MASIGNDDGGRRRILFVAPDGKRKTVRLGKVTERQAQAYLARVEALLGAQHTSMDEDLAKWLSKLDDKMHKRFAAAGLAKPREHGSMTLNEFLVEFLKSVPVKPGTAVTYAQTQRCLTDYFGVEKPIRDIEPADADGWRSWMRESEGLAQSTISRRVKTARQAFKKACKWKIISENPFADVVAGAQTNKARQYFISPEDATKVLDHCPDAEWKVLFALSRYGGLRCPSEHLLLKWGDIDWAAGRIRVSSPKTEGKDGGEHRYVPLFPELRPYLLEAFEAAPDGAEFVITRYRDRTQNLRTQLGRIIRRAKLTPWPKLFHNLRSSRQTELALRYPIHLVCAWLGNSRAVAQDHYLQVVAEHFQGAGQTGLPVKSGTESGTLDAPSEGVSCRQEKQSAAAGDA